MTLRGRIAGWLAGPSEAIAMVPLNAAAIAVLLRVVLMRRADPRLGAPGALPALGPEAPAALRQALGVLRFRYQMLKELDHDDGDG